MNQTPDDIFALYSRFDLDGENYRVFPSRDTAVAKHAPAPKQAPPESAGPAELKDDKSDVPDPAPRPMSNGTANRMALQRIWRHTTAVTPDLNLTSSTLAASSISIHGAAGGTGSSTVAAMLARLLAKTGKRCAIFDESEDSILPIFFGAQRIAADHRRFSGLYSIFEPSIRILNREMFEETPNSTSNQSFIERHFAQLADQFEHLIFDQPARCPENMGANLNICVAVPDVSSLVGVRKLKRDLNASSVPAKSICVLNKFDATIALHREVLDWYHDNFDQVVTLRYSPLVPEALAEGTTIVDWAPRTSASLDFLSLFNAVNQLWGRGAISGTSRFEAANFEGERLELCS